MQTVMIINYTEGYYGFGASLQEAFKACEGKASSSYTAKVYTAPYEALTIDADLNVTMPDGCEVVKLGNFKGRLK